MNLTVARSIAEGLYGVSEALKQQCRRYPPAVLLEVLDRFGSRLPAS